MLTIKMKKYNMSFDITITLAILAFASATQTAFALEPAPTRYQKGYNDGSAAITLPCSHTITKITIPISIGVL
jgi:hypothetical protein